MTRIAAPRYDTIGAAYTAHRRTDPQWAALIEQHLGPARRVVNIGAGTGSYEPPTRQVVAIEPSSLMVSQRPEGAAPAVRAGGAALPLRDDSFEAAMAILTIHHWDDWVTGLWEMRRVARRRLVLTIDFEVHARFWLLADYLPTVARAERQVTPSVADIAAILPEVDVRVLPLRADMADGVLGAHWRRPQAYLDPLVRSNCSPLALADQGEIERGMALLRADLESGAWQRRHADLMEADALDVGYRLVVSVGP